MFFNKNKEDNFNLVLDGFTIVEEKQNSKFSINKSFKNRIKLSSFLMKLRFELSKFNKNEEEVKKMTKEEVISKFPKMNEFFQTKETNYLFISKGGVDTVIDSVEFGEVSVLNKKGKAIFNKNFKNFDEKELEI